MGLPGVPDEKKGFWIGAKVLERDEAGQPAKVEILSYGINRIAVREKLLQNDEVCIFFAGEIPQGGYLIFL